MELRTYQSEAVEAAWSHLCYRAGSPVIVLPTGAGKSLCIAALCRDATERFGGRVIVLAHRKELLEQNAEKIQKLLPNHQVGIYSAGLRRFSMEDNIIVAGIQSAYKKAELFGSRQLVVIDEVHLVPRDGEGMYRTFLGDLARYNPKLKKVGLTATPFRTGEGSLCRQDALFQEICYDASIVKLIDDGYLCPVTNKVAAGTLDTSKLHIRGGEFVGFEVEKLFGQADAVTAACKEIVEKTSDRHSVLIFCSGISHAERVAEEIAGLAGVRCGLVTGDTLAMERSETLRRFKSRELKFLCNVDVLTTGFDAPCIDAIAILRATASPGLFAQICGRGFRRDPSKADCVILDFGENLKRHGPIDAPNFGKQDKQAGAGGDGDAPSKTCPNCGQGVALSTKECQCGFVFPRQERQHEQQADAESTLLQAAEPPTKWIVEEIIMTRHVKRNAPPETPDTLRVTYLCVPSQGGGNLARKEISEWVCLEHDGFARRKAQHWWTDRSNAPCPDSINDALNLWGRGAIASVRSIETKPDGKFLRIVSFELDEKPETWADEAIDFDFGSSEEAAF